MSAAVPNFKVMEIDIDDVTWTDDIVTAPPSSRTATCFCRPAPTGADVNEEFVRAHRPRR